MKNAAHEQFRRPACRSGGLQLAVTEADDGGEVMEGELECPRCGENYAVKGGIPRFVLASNYSDSFGSQWNVHAKTQLDSYSGLPISTDRLFGITGWERDLSGQKILEAGSGAGRFTEVILGTGADLFTFDYSTAVDANWENNCQKGKLNLFQGDIFNIPVEEASFDKVMCLGVIQHTPDLETGFRSLAKYVKPGVQLAIDVYRVDWGSWFQWKYLLRPITKRMDKQKLYGRIERFTPPLVPAASFLRSVLGSFGRRVLPIIEYAHLGLPPELNVQEAILDTFDMYSPAHDHPQSVATARAWYASVGFTNVEMKHGPNEVVATGWRPADGETSAVT